MVLGHPVYNQFRSDIATAFPNLQNSNGPVGYFILDTTKLTNGVHTIGWVVYDNQGRGDGIGSRFITVQNTGMLKAAEEALPADTPFEGITLRRGHDLQRPLERLMPDADGEYVIEMQELDHIELSLGARAGFLVVNGVRRALPIGSTLKHGTFYWHAGPGFVGNFQLLFDRIIAPPIHIGIKINPRVFSY